METYAVDGNTLAAIGGILGTLAGIITWLLKRLLRSKDEQIATAQTETLKTEHDRDYYRDLAMRLMSERAYGYEYPGQAPRGLRPPDLPARQEDV